MTLPLAPCPYCHSADLDSWQTQSQSFCILCQACHAHGPLGASEDIASTLWNAYCAKRRSVDVTDDVESGTLREWLRHLRRKEQIGCGLLVLAFLSWFAWLAWFIRSATR
jgi:hypothetical protein